MTGVSRRPRRRRRFHSSSIDWRSAASVVFAREQRLEAVEDLLVGGCSERAELRGDLGALKLLVPGQMGLVAASGQCHGEPEPRLYDVLDHDHFANGPNKRSTFVAGRICNQRRDLMLHEVEATGFEPSRHRLRP